MTAKHQYVLTDFSLAEVELICGPRAELQIVGAEPNACDRVSLPDVIAIAVRNEAAGVGIARLEPGLLDRCVRSALWYAIWEQDCFDDEGGRPVKDAAPEEGFADVISRIANISPSTLQRFILAARGRGPETMSSSAFHGEFDEACTPPTMTGLRLVDLAGVGHQIAERAGRPLVTIEGLRAPRQADRA